jgi:hypothetical protein
MHIDAGIPVEAPWEFERVPVACHSGMAAHQTSIL